MIKKIAVSFLLCFLLGTGIFAGTSGVFAEEDIDSKQLYESALADFENREYSSSVDKLKKLLEKEPESSEALLLLGRNYSIQEEFELAKPYFAKFIKLEPKSPKGYLGMAGVYNGEELTPIAVMYFDKALSMRAPKYVKKNILNMRQAVIDIQKMREGTESYTNVKNPGISLFIDIPKWYNAYFDGNAYAWTFEYGRVGENVIDYKWTKLITVHYFSKYAFDMSIDDLFESQCEFIKQQADYLNSPVSVKILKRNDKSIYYMWSIPNFKESEIARIYDYRDGIYVIRYTAKRKFFLPNEVEDIVNMLGSFKTTN